MIGALARKIFGTPNDRRIKSYQSRVDAINALEPDLVALSDEALRYLLCKRFYIDVGGRFFLPVPNAFGDLALDGEKIGPTWIRHLASDVSGPRLLAPFFVRHRRSDSVDLRDLPKLVRWVSARLAKPASEAHVTQRYVEFIEHVRGVIGSDWGGLTDDDVARAKLELSREFPPATPR